MRDPRASSSKPAALIVTAYILIERQF